ncbi:MAG TPA: HipA domain-containing protein [Chitinophagales bacterium]
MQPPKIDTKFIDATAWQNLSWLNSGGTRAKKILQDFEEGEYYFKCSEKKEAKYYKYEFWNEIIAYQLGLHLGLDMLRYDVAVFENEIGCISPKMITDEEHLVEVGSFMTAQNPDFLPENNKARKQYTSQLLEETLKTFDLAEFLPFFFRTLLFDVIIGNTDRHQENWAFIVNDAKIKTAPIYDNVSCLARELNDVKVSVLLSDEKELLKYINIGKSELHWNGNKLTHFDLMKEILNSQYAEMLRKEAVFLQNWQTDVVEKIMSEVDIVIPEKWQEFCIPVNRKSLIVKLLTLRFQKLQQIINGGI